MAVSPTAHVIDFCLSGILVEMVQGIHQIITVNIVPNLFSLVAENSVRFFWIAQIIR